jgi:hypothetical protein
VKYEIRPPAPVAPLSKERSELYVHPKRRTAAEVAANTAAQASPA